MKFNLSEATSAMTDMVNSFIQRLPYLAVAIVVFFVFYFIGKGIRVIAERNHRHHNLSILLGRITHIVTVFIGLLLALAIAIPDFTPGQLIGILGLSSVAVGLAFREILQNFFAGLLLLWAEPFRIGDQIIVNDYEGTVEDIQTSATFLRTYDGRRVVIPNAALFTNSVMVNTAHDNRRLQYDIRIAYGGNITDAKRILLETMRASDEVLDDPEPTALVIQLDENSIQIRLRWWVAPPRQFDVFHSQDVVLENSINALLENGFDVPYSTKKVLLQDRIK